MGLIKAATGAAGGVLADSWREFFYCDSMESDTLMVKGSKRTSSQGRSSNTKGEDNIISDGSRIAVNDGQCMILVESGKVVELCAETGEFTYDQSTEPSVFYGSLGESILASIQRIGDRFTFGGDTGKDQRVYFVNLKEIVGNKFGTTSPIPFRVVDKNIGLDVDLAVRTNGLYSFRVTDPIAFYANIAGNVPDEYKVSSLEEQLKAEMLSALQPAFAKVSALGIRYSELPGHVTELTNELIVELEPTWGKRGITLQTVSLNAVNVSDEDAELVKEMQKAGALRDPSLAAASIAAAQGDAMRSAAQNENGAMMGFMGMGMAQAAGGANVNQLFETAEASRSAAAAAAGAAGASFEAGAWTCSSCGTKNSGNFCGQCGTKRPESGAWFCTECGTRNEQGKFCSNCGTPRQQG